MKIKILFFLIIISSKSLFSQFNGTYIIGGPNGVYPLLSLAIQAIEQQGVTGPVTFKIYPGNYPENIRIQNIPGNSITNTLTIESTTGNPDDVVFEYTPQVSSSKVFWLYNAKNVRIRNITIKNTSNNFMSCLGMNGQIRNIEILNNRFICNTVALNLPNYNSISGNAISYSSTLDSNTIIIRKNKIYNGNNGIVGILDKINSKVIIEYNYIENIFEMGTNSAFDTLIFLNNYIDSHKSNCSFSVSNLGHLIFKGNTLKFKISKSIIGFGGKEIEIINNSIVGEGLKITSDSSVIINNTIISNNNCITFYELTVKKSTLINNILISDSSNSIYELPPIFISDNNCFKSTNDTIIKTHFNAYTLSMWQNAMNKDLNSGYGLPLFSKSGDYHIQGNNPLIIGKGVSIAEITHDIDGDLRDLSFPCIGADEFAIRPVFDSIYKACIGSSFVLNAGAGFQSYQWNTGASTQTITIPSASGIQNYSCIVGFNGQFGSAATRVQWMNCTGIEQPINNNHLLIYPNPTNTTLNIQFSENQSLPQGILQIFSIQGKLVKEIEVTSQQSILQVDVKSLNPGFYIGKLVKENDENWSFRFIK